MKNLSKYLFYLGFLSPFAVISCTSQIQFVKNNPPKVGNNLPEVETTPPKVGNNLPEVETNPPKVETTPPEIQTNPPKVEDNLPKVETKPPEIQTTPPKVEDNLPKVETKPPEIQTNLPKVETNEGDKKQPEKIDSLKPGSEKTTDTEVKIEDENDSESDEQNQPIFDFVQVNIKSFRNFRPDLLSDLKEDDFKAPSNQVSNYSRYLLRNWQNVVKKENQNTFLGQKNNNLKVYLIDKMNPNLVGNINAKQNHFAYFNRPALGNYYNLPWFGFNSDSLEQKRFSNIFTRNMRFATGTGILLNTNSEKAAFLTNAHVIHSPGNNRVPFWKLMNKKVGQNELNPKLTKFLQYYDDFKIKELDNRILFRLFEQEEKIKKGVPNFPFNRQSNAKINQYMEDLYQNYFELAEWDNYGFDIAVFYFNYSKFISDVDKLIKFFSEHQQNFINSTYWLQNGKFQNFVKDFAEFKKYWQKISKFPPLKISDRIWEDGDFDYTTKIGMFWANNLFSKNVFKGINFRRDANDPRLVAANFFATNGPGASGSGIFNADGSLAFINRSILTVNGNVHSLFYDQFGLTSHLTSGIALRARNYNLVERILKLYVK
ncbi:Mhp366/Mhp367 family surface (lipo)protein [Mesomycoplasma ovipneumoniae]|uniref:Mhp366/Mhp367 family surface (lipo)protein n=1 Tax=Mesomycoplasma ovipneumoniae TaxID=29562 RepID=UPI003080C8F2